VGLRSSLEARIVGRAMRNHPKRIQRRWGAKQWIKKALEKEIEPDDSRMVEIFHLRSTPAVPRQQRHLMPSLAERAREPSHPDLTEVRIVVLHHKGDVHRCLKIRFNGL
jgi:hypothetical protein